jgi:hypothetical protein
MGGRRFLAISKPYVYRLDARLTEGQPDEAIVRQFWFYFPEKVVRSEEAHPPSNFSGGQLIGSHRGLLARAGRIAATRSIGQGCLNLIESQEPGDRFPSKCAWSRAGVVTYVVHLTTLAGLSDRPAGVGGDHVPGRWRDVKPGTVRRGGELDSSRRIGSPRSSHGEAIVLNSAPENQCTAEAP